MSIEIEDQIKELEAIVEKMTPSLVIGRIAPVPCTREKFIQFCTECWDKTPDDDKTEPLLLCNQELDRIVAILGSGQTTEANAEGFVALSHWSLDIIHTLLTERHGLKAKLEAAEAAVMFKWWETIERTHPRRRETFCRHCSAQVPYDMDETDHLETCIVRQIQERKAADPNAQKEVM